LRQEGADGQDHHSRETGWGRASSLPYFLLRRVPVATDTGPPHTPVQVTLTPGGGREIWLGRVICLALMVGAWLGFAGFVEMWAVERALLARGKTTVAKRTREEKIRSSRYKAYHYEAAGREYKDSTEGTDDPEGQTVTYLPENPSVHRLGVI